MEGRGKGGTKVRVLSLHKGSLDRHETFKSQKKDGRDGKGEKSESKGKKTKTKREKSYKEKVTVFLQRSVHFLHPEL